MGRRLYPCTWVTPMNTNACRYAIRGYRYLWVKIVILITEALSKPKGVPTLIQPYHFDCMVALESLIAPINK
jgi:hypothetical protein